VGFRWFRRSEVVSDRCPWDNRELAARPAPGW